MRAEKANISQEYLTRLNASPFFIVVDYQGLKVGPMTELRKRLVRAGAEIHVVKNSIFRIAAKESGLADLKGVMSGQMAVVTGQKPLQRNSKGRKSNSGSWITDESKPQKSTCWQTSLQWTFSERSFWVS
jgi:ribosomal protein L10